MATGRRKIQLRRCQACQRVGHNRATCPTPTVQIRKASPTQNRTAKTAVTNISSQVATPKENEVLHSTVAQPLKFFIHHVNHEPPQSPHVLNLKKDNDSWSGVAAASPEINTDLYHTYHKPQFTPKESLPEVIPTTQITTAPILPDQPHKTWRESFSESIARIKPNKVESTFKVSLTDKPLHLERESLLLETTTHEPIRERLQTVLQGLFSKQRLALASILLMIMVIIPGPALSYYQTIVTTKDSLIKDSTEAFLALQDSTLALKQADLSSATHATDVALIKFQTVLNQLDDTKLLRTLASIVPVVGGSLTSRENIVLAGQEITLGNKHLLEGVTQSNDPALTTLTARFKAILTKVHTSLPYYQRAHELFNEVDVSVLPYEYQGQFIEYKQLFGTIVKDFKTIDELGATLLEIFGAAGQRRYLLVFQNPHELRATGGFAGSFAILEVKNGEIVKLDIPAGGTYDLQGQLSQFVAPPTPLLITNKRWEFQDANWFPDFPTSAEKTLWFYRHSYGVTADGVIAINASVLERLLSVLGPVVDTKRDVSLDSETAVQVLQKIVEEGPEKKINKPKQIISDIAPELITSIKSIGANNILPLLSTMQEALSQKEIQAYFSDQQTQKTVVDFGWSGRMLPASDGQDFIMVVNTNIQGQKSDAKIEQGISHQAVVSQDGTVIATVVVSRHHTGDKGEKLYGQTNINYLRLYVPEGSELISASGFTWPDEKAFRVPEDWYKKDVLLEKVEQNEQIDEQTGTRITTEFNKTAFGNWVITEPGETSQIQFTYKLPFKINPKIKPGNLEKVLKPFKKELTEYQLLVERQSGSKSTFESQIIFPDNWQTSWQEGDGMILAANGAKIISRPLVKDTVWSLIMEKL